MLKRNTTPSGRPALPPRRESSSWELALVLYQE